MPLMVKRLKTSFCILTCDEDRFGKYVMRVWQQVKIWSIDNYVLSVRVKRLQNFVNVYTEVIKRNGTVKTFQ